MVPSPFIGRRVQGKAPQSSLSKIQRVQGDGYKGWGRRKQLPKASAIRSLLGVNGSGSGQDAFLRQVAGPVLGDTEGLQDFLRGRLGFLRVQDNPIAEVIPFPGSVVQLHQVEG